MDKKVCLILLLIVSVGVELGEHNIPNFIAHEPEAEDILEFVNCQTGRQM